MKYTISMNQKIIVDSGLPLDITDGAILDFINSFVHSDVVVKSTFEGKTYYWISYDLVIKNLPILRVKKDTVYRKFKEYIAMGLLDAHPMNRELNRAFFAINKKFMSLFFSSDDEGDLRKNFHTPYGKKSGGPTEKNPGYYSIKDNDIKDNDSESSKEDSFISPTLESDSPTQEESSVEPQRRMRALAKKLKEPLDPCYHDFVRIWIEAYPGFRFGAVEGRKIKDLIPKLRWHLKAAGKPETTEAVNHLWQYIVNYLRRGQSPFSNKSLKFIDSTIDQIIYEIRNGIQRPETPYQKQQRELAALRSRPIQDF